MRKVLIKRILQCMLQLCAVGLLSVQAEAKINRAMIEFKQTPLEKALQKISEVYKVTFTYEPSVVQTGIRIDLERKERTLQEVLNLVSGKAGLSFMQVGSMIGVKQARQQMAAPQQEEVTISGKVT